MITTDQGYISALRDWLVSHQPLLSERGISVTMPSKLRGSGITATLTSEQGEADFQVWNNGLSDVMLVDLGAALGASAVSERVTVTHYEYQEVDEMYAALRTLINQLSPVPRSKVLAETVAQK